MKKTVADWKEEFIMIKCEVCRDEFKAATNLRRFCVDCRIKRKKIWTESHLRKKYGSSEPSDQIKAERKRVEKPMNLFKTR